MDTFDRYIGQVFDKRYKIVKLIGVGGMAAVFEATDLVMKRTVAVKMLKDEIVNDVQSVKRFINESKAVSMLSHPNIVSIYDVSFKDDLKYIVMERVEGITLKNYMNKKGALPFREVVNFAEQILTALEHAHGKGIIHRDIKPQNIMLLKNGRLKVADFGIAKLPNAETVTMTDKAIGTVSYISPEQASGKPIDPRSDLYSLGVLMYEMATGTLPFDGETPVSVALKQVNDEPRRPRELLATIPLGLEQIILEAMEKLPENRFQSAEQMLRYITQIRSDQSYVFNTRKNIPKNPEVGTVPAKGRKKERAEKKERERDNGTSMFPIIAGVAAAFLIVIGISAVSIIMSVLSPEGENSPYTVTIQNYVGSKYSNELYNSLVGTNYLKVNVEYVYDENFAENVIIEQEPTAGSTRKVINGKQYCDINFTVSRGKETFDLPDFTVTEYRAAKIKLEKMEVNVELKHEHNDIVPEGYIIKTEPQAGTVLSAGSTVTMYVSRGAKVEKVKIPDFVGKTESEAYKLLISEKLVLGEVRYENSDEVPKGRIISQSREADSEGYRNVTKIDFVVSSGVENYVW